MLLQGNFGKRRSVPFMQCSGQSSANNLVSFSLSLDCLQVEVVSKYQLLVNSVRNHHWQSQSAKQTQQSFQEETSRHSTLCYPLLCVNAVYFDTRSVLLKQN